MPLGHNDFAVEWMDNTREPWNLFGALGYLGVTGYVSGWLLHDEI